MARNPITRRAAMQARHSLFYMLVNEWTRVAK